MTTRKARRDRQRPGAATTTDVVAYYREATLDYRAWSRKLHMHFGYWRRGVNPLRLDDLLDEMTRQVWRGLDLAEDDNDRPLRLGDLGCGLGASARLAASERPAWTVLGLTLLREQALEADALSAPLGAGRRTPRFVTGDYRRAPIADESLDGAWAIESACHAPGPDKREFLEEAFRVLRPGARLSIADGFLKKSGPMNPLLRACLRRVSGNWAVDTFAELPAFVAALDEIGFVDLSVREISYRIAPSVLHIPWVTTRFLVAQLVRSRLRLGRVRWGHLEACVLSPIVGAARARFGYYLVSARRPDAARSPRTRQLAPTGSSSSLAGGSSDSDGAGKATTPAGLSTITYTGLE